MPTLAAQFSDGALVVLPCDLRAVCFEADRFLDAALFVAVWVFFWAALLDALAFAAPVFPVPALDRAFAPERVFLEVLVGDLAMTPLPMNRTGTIVATATNKALAQGSLYVPVVLWSPAPSQGRQLCSWRHCKQAALAS